MWESALNVIELVKISISDGFDLFAETKETSFESGSFSYDNAVCSWHCKCW